MKEKNFYEEIKDWNFSYFNIETEYYTNWHLYQILKLVTNSKSKILDLGTGGGEKVLSCFPNVKEVIATDFSPGMIETANKNLKRSGKSNIVFRIMDNLKMDTSDGYFDVVVARNTVTDPKQIYKTLKDEGYLLLRGVDKMDCWELKRIFNKGQGFKDKKPISQIDYENILDAGFSDAELIPIHQIEYFKTRDEFINFLYKVPILDDFSEDANDNKMYYNTKIDETLLDKYIKRNISSKGIRLVRRYYGIMAKK